jgi:hypothetical protein
MQGILNMNSRHPLVIVFVIFAVSGCTASSLANIAVQNAIPIFDFLGDTVDAAAKLFEGEKNESTTEPYSLSTSIEDAQLCEYSTSDFGKNWETEPFLDWVQEAKSIGLTLADCARLLCKTPVSTPSPCNG